MWAVLILVFQAEERGRHVARIAAGTTCVLQVGGNDFMNEAPSAEIMHLIVNKLTVIYLCMRKKSYTDTGKVSLLHNTL